MAFNSDSYYRNKWRRDAFELLARAREIKARALAGDAYDWELPMIASNASLARSTWRLYLSQREIIAIKRGAA